MTINIEKLQEVAKYNTKRNSGIDRINEDLKKYLSELKEQAIENLTEDEASKKINEIISIVEDSKTQETKYDKFSNSFATVKENVKKLDNGFPIFFLFICKKLSYCKDRRGVIEVCDRFSSAFNPSSDSKDKYKQLEINGFTALSVSEILHCIQPYYIPILSTKNKGDIFKVCKSENGEFLKSEKQFKEFANNIKIIYEFCENYKLPKSTEYNDGFDFALIDDAILNYDENKETGSKNNGETQNDWGNAMNEVNIEFDKNMILFGPPGTGKTYNTVIYAVAICDGLNINDTDDENQINQILKKHFYGNDNITNDEYKTLLARYNALKNPENPEKSRIAFTTFHQSYGYEEFIEGIKPVMENSQKKAVSSANEDANETNNEVANISKDVKYEIKPGFFKSFCNAAKEDKNKQPYVFIIDEINRGNISKIFGELITLIEPTKRTGEAEAMEAILPYSNESFGVPNNVYILGTMNTADRSIAIMDTALRRRFQFVEMLPDPNVLSGITVSDNNGKTIDVKQLLTDINKRIEYLYDREHTIGHAFFTKLNKNSKVSDLGKIFEKSVIPLLQEYFYDDYKKIMLVLGYDPKPIELNESEEPTDRLIVAVNLNENSILNVKNEDIDIPDCSYKIIKGAFSNIESYVKMIQKKEDTNQVTQGKN